MPALQSRPPRPLAARGRPSPSHSGSTNRRHNPTHPPTTRTSAVSKRGPMLSRAFSRRRDDSGAALMVALIFILVVGLIVTAALSKSGAVLRSDYLVRDTAQVQYGSDAAVDRALQLLRDDLKGGNPTICPSDADGPA